MDRPLFTIPLPAYDSQLVGDLFEIEKLKQRQPGSTVHPGVLDEVRQVVQMLDCLGSARLDGNNTTNDEVVQSVALNARNATRALREITNLERATRWIDLVYADNPEHAIDKRFVDELHRLTMMHMRSPAKKADSERRRLFGELIAFINAPRSIRYELLRIAIAYHRFLYLQPYGDGNGRVARLLMYAMLSRAGVRTVNGHVVNPTAIFSQDTATYRKILSNANDLSESSTLAWCSFVLWGLRQAFTKTTLLCDDDVLTPQVLEPALREVRDRDIITRKEFAVLRNVLSDGIADAPIIRKYYPDFTPAALSMMILRYKRCGLLAPYPDSNSRRYVVKFSGPLLLRPMINALDRAGYLPQHLTP